MKDRISSERFKEPFLHLCLLFGVAFAVLKEGFHWNCAVRTHEQTRLFDGFHDDKDRVFFMWLIWNVDCSVIVWRASKMDLGSGFSQNDLI